MSKGGLGLAHATYFREAFIWVHDNVIDMLVRSAFFGKLDMFYQPLFLNVHYHYSVLEGMIIM